MRNALSPTDDPDFLPRTLHEARCAARMGMDRPFIVDTWEDRPERLKDVDRAIAAAVRDAVLHAGPAEDRERWGRAVHEARMAREEQAGDPFSVPWTARAQVARDEDEAIGAAVAAQAVHDAGLRNERLEAHVLTVGAHAPAIRRALVAAITSAEYEAEARPYRDALKILGTEEGQEP